MSDIEHARPIEWHDDEVAEETPTLRRKPWYQALGDEAKAGFLYGAARFGGLGWQDRFSTASRCAKDAADALAAERRKVKDLAIALRKAREYVASVHGSMASAMGHERTAVKPDLDEIDAVLAMICEPEATDA